MIGPPVVSLDFRSTSMSSRTAAALEGLLLSGQPKYWYCQITLLSLVRVLVIENCLSVYVPYSVSCAISTKMLSYWRMTFCSVGQYCVHCSCRVEEGGREDRRERERESERERERAVLISFRLTLHTYTFLFSSVGQSITMLYELCSQTILQKSFTVFTRGPWVSMYCWRSVYPCHY